VAPLPPSPFFAALEKEAAKNGAGFGRWCFLPGMLFTARHQWWDQRQRRTPHEGLDLLYFLDADGGRQALLPGTPLVAAFAGRVAGSIPDFLGQTVIVRHGIQDREGRWLHSLYGHCRPLAAAGQEVQAGEVLAGIGPRPPGSSGAPAHLHLSLAWLATEIAAARLSWPELAGTPGIRLLDPLRLLGNRGGPPLPCPA
jgi:murein DD-endopeptidase MepM/ murein hydrolase activator NlpD